MSDNATNPPKLFESRLPIFPRRVKGNFRTLKWRIMMITLLVYYVTPWIRWDRGPDLPDQAVLVDLASRRFFMFWIEIWPHEFYFVAGLLILAGIGLFLFTSALGRVWCGYSCPQTVWVDLFILVERWVEGDRNARVKLWNADMTVRKFRLRMTKFAIWLLIAIATGGAWVFYFADAPTLLKDIITLNAQPVAYMSIGILTATTFIFAGFMREQVCNYMCPWPRIQAAMMDENTLTVGYRAWRGEPRGKHRKADSAAGLGDCIDCNACVAVCPAGIDIRDGQQMECITCALCIDACDDVMTKIGKPRGLIDYLAFTDEAHERAGNPPIKSATHIFRPRVMLYTAVWAMIGIGLIAALFIRPNSDISVAPVRQPQYVLLSDGSVRNTYEISVRNQGGAARKFAFSLSQPELKMNIEGVEGHVVEVPADETGHFRMYIIAPADHVFASTDASPLVVSANTDATHNEERTVFNGASQ